MSEFSRAEVQRWHDEDPGRFAVEATDEAWFQVTGMCGGCGGDCGCGGCVGAVCSHCPDRTGSL